MTIKVNYGVADAKGEKVRAETITFESREASFNSAVSVEAFDQATAKLNREKGESIYYLAFVTQKGK